MARAEEVPQGWMLGKKFKLRVESDFTKERGFQKGDVVKVVMVSRFGDCGLTKDLTAEYGYNLRVAPKDLEPVSGLPDTVCEKCHYLFDDHDGKCIEPVKLG